MNISLQFEPIDCSFYDWPFDTYTDTQQIKNNDNDNNTMTSCTKKQKQTLRCRHAIDELLQTERDYTEHLTHLVTVYFDQILWRQKWMMDTHKKTIIRNANELLQFHQSLLVALEEACLNKDILERCGQVATVFLDMGSSFTLYDKYCDKHDVAIALCNEYRSKSEWMVFIKDCSTATFINSHSDNNNLSSLDQPTKPLQFEDYLIKPVQRVCRYQLLLKEILHHTPRNTTEFRRLDCALGMMQALVTGIDQRKYHRDTTERTRLFMDRLDYSLSEGRLDKNSLYLLGNLVMAGAIDVIYSSLGQTSAASSSRSKYFGCFIFPTYLIMVRPKKLTSYAPKHWFPLRLVELEDLQDINDQREHAFVVRCKKHCFAFTATCQREKKLWLTKLSQAIASAKSQPRSADNFIISSLHGIIKSTKIRTSRSVTNLLDFGRESSPSSSFAPTSMNLGDDDVGGKKPTNENKIVKRSKSHNFQLASYCHTHDPSSCSNISSMKSSASPPPLIQPPIQQQQQQQRMITALSTSLNKRHSADFSPRVKKREQLKARIHSEMYIRPPPPPELGNDGIKLQRQRPGSMDLMSTSSSQLSLNMIGKLKNNHQHALRMGADHKLRDVCTQDYLASRSWSTLLRESSNGHQSSYSNSDNSSNSSSSPTEHGKRKSSLSNLRPSTSSFSMLMNSSKRPTNDGIHAQSTVPYASNDNSNTLLSSPMNEEITTSNKYGKQPANTRPTPPARYQHQQKQRKQTSMPSSSIPRYTVHQLSTPINTTTSTSSVPPYGSFDFQQYYHGKSMNVDSRRYKGDMLPSLTQDTYGQKKKTTLRASLSTYSLNIQPMKSNVKHVFRRFSSGQPKQTDSIIGHGLKTSQIPGSSSPQRNNNITKRSSRLFSWMKHDDHDTASSLSSSITTQHNESIFSSTSSTSTTTTSTNSYILPRTSITTAMMGHMRSKSPSSSSFSPTPINHQFYGKSNNKPNWSRKWIPSRK